MMPVYGACASVMTSDDPWLVKMAHWMLRWRIQEHVETCRQEKVLWRVSQWRLAGVLLLQCSTPAYHHATPAFSMM